MIIQEEVEQLKSDLQSLVGYKNKELIRRSEWGSINFELAEVHIQSIMQIAKDLLELPVENLSYKATSDLLTSIVQTTRALKRLDLFKLEDGRVPASDRDEINDRLQKAAEDLTISATPLIPYLAYRSGDISENIATINNATKEAKESLHRTKDWVIQQQKKVEDIVQIARNTTANSGVQRFTPEFDKEAERQSDLSINWLIATAILAASTIGVALGFYLSPATLLEANSWNTLHIILSKAAVIAVLFTGTIWCGRIYRALVHQAAVNRHRALSLKTFQTFVEGTKDGQVRDAVLMAATNTVFSNVPTGFVESSGDQDSKINYVKMSKSFKRSLEE